MKRVYLMLATATLSPAASRAKWKPQYASNSPEIRDWYKSRNNRMRRLSRWALLQAHRLK
jgi:hypothetical protein